MPVQHSVNQQEKKGAARSLFFVIPVCVLLASVVIISNSANAPLLLLHALLSLLMLLVARAEAPGKLFFAVLHVQVFSLFLALFVLFSESEGQVLLDARLVQLTEQGLAKALVLYLQLHALFWLSKALMLLWGRQNFVAGLSILLTPLRLFRVDPACSAGLLARSLALLPVFLGRVSRALRSGLPGLIRLLRGGLGKDSWQLAPPPERPARETGRLLFFARLYTGVLIIFGLLMLVEG